MGYTSFKMGHVIKHNKSPSPPYETHFCWQQFSATGEGGQCGLVQGFSGANSIIGTLGGNVNSQAQPGPLNQELWEKRPEFCV